MPVYINCKRVDVTNIRNVAAHGDVVVFYVRGRRVGYVCINGKLRTGEQMNAGKF